MAAYGAIVIGACVIGALLAMVMMRRRGGEAFSGRLRQPLLLSVRPELSMSDQTIEVDAGTPYRVIEVHGGAVLIEVLRPDGSRERGYTTTAHVRA